MEKWKISSIVELVKWILSSDSLEQEDIQEGSDVPPQLGRRTGKEGFVKWIFSTETLGKEPEETRPSSPWGKGGFLAWLFSAEELGEEPEMKKKPSRFGERGFIRWLTGSENIEKTGGK